MKDGTGQTPEQLLVVDFGTTAFIGGSLGVQLDKQTLMAGRRKIAEQLGADAYLSTDSERSGANAALYSVLFQMPVFMHLWFLAFLCWLVVAFLIYAVVANAVNIARLPRWLVCSPASLLWVIPLTTLPLSFMQPGIFGPDSSVGLLPIPAVFAYYAIFFFFGAVYWDMNDGQGQLGRWWLISLPVAILVVFPIGLDLVEGTFGIVPRIEDLSTLNLVSNLLQATFAWLMIFGCIGLFRRTLSGESKTLRYISDSSYWLYLTHLPLVILAQWMVRDMEAPAFLKFTVVLVVISAFLLLTYQYMVRYTAIGQLLNGPRSRSPLASAGGERQSCPAV